MNDGGGKEVSEDVFKYGFTGQIMVTRIHVAITDTSTQINDLDGQPIMTIA